jgi:hypothetical protein
MSLLDMDAAMADLSTVNTALESQSKKSTGRDERYWQPLLDKEGNGGAVLRFLPQPGTGPDKPPYIRLLNYYFKYNGQTFSENCPLTIKQPCPINEYLKPFWETDRDYARRFNKRVGYIANVLVVKHKARPEDEGKVFLYRFGKKINDKLEAVMNPKDEDEVQWNPFSPKYGANFKLSIKQVSGFNNYDDSKFLERGPIDPSAFKDGVAIYDLDPEVAPSKFKSYEDLKKKFFAVIGKPAETDPSLGETLAAVKAEEDAAAPPLPQGDEESLDWYKKLVNA